MGGDMFIWAILLVISSISSGSDIPGGYPDGYFPFEESQPGESPPKVRKPPYIQTEIPCPGVTGHAPEDQSFIDTLCGDLNTGYLPRNPMEQAIGGHPYPFELIKNHTLKYFSNLLPVLKNDNNLPKVAKYEDSRLKNEKYFSKKNSPAHRQKRSTDEAEARSAEARRARAFCDQKGNVFCKIYGLFTGKISSRNDYYKDEDDRVSSRYNSLDNVPAPLTPCPSTVEYVTPVFARNYQGVWRYVVQIPHEGYFTQTVEVTNCMTSSCHYLEGSCLSSPRWVSLLVAEMYYPDSYFTKTPVPGVVPSASSHKPPSENFDDYQRYIQKRAEQLTTPKPSYCDGRDEIGCYQVRLYYDWFLVPGACKCWRRGYFDRFVRNPK